MGKILAANHNIGSAMAMVQPLKLLVERGHGVVTFATNDNVPAWKVFANDGLKPRSLDYYMLYHRLDSNVVRKMLSHEHFDIVLVGISDNSGDGVEQLLINAASDAGIPVAAIVESWPHNWLNTFPEQIPTYRKVQRLLVFDELSRTRMIESQFEADRVIATGNPVYDNLAAEKCRREEYRNEYLKRFGLGADDPMMLFVWAVTQNLDDEPAEGHPEWLGFKEAPLLAEFLAAVEEARSINPFCRAVVRQKPYYGTNTVQGLIEGTCPGFTQLENSGPAMMPVVAADAIFGTTTLLLEQAAFCDTPAISYLPGRAKTDTKLTNKIRVTFPLYEHEGMAGMIFVIAQDPYIALSLIEGSTKSVNLPECATKNVADVLEGLIKR